MITVVIVHHPASGPVPLSLGSKYIEPAHLPFQRRQSSVQKRIVRVQQAPNPEPLQPTAGADPGRGALGFIHSLPLVSKR